MTFSWRDHESSVQFVDPAQHRLAVPHDELVVHEVGNAGDRACLEGQRLDRLGRGLRRRGHRDRPGVGDVVDEADGDSALHRREQGCEHERPRVRLEAHVVERDVERRPRRCEERRDAARDVRGALAAVRQRAQLDRSPRRAGRHLAAAAARSAALCARFAAWYSARSSGDLIFPRHGCSGTSSCAALDSEVERQHGAEAGDLHLPEAGERTDSLPEVGRVGRLRPDPLGIAVVVVRDDLTQLLHSLRHRAREPVDRRRLAERRLERLGIHRRDRARVERADPLLQLERPGERLLDGDLLVDRKPDQERERLGRDQSVGLVRIGEVERLGHASDGRRGRIPWANGRARRPLAAHEDLVRAGVRGADAGAGARVACHCAGRARPHPGADRLGEDARGLPPRHRPIDGDARRGAPPALRLAAEGAQLRHRAESP